MDEAVTDCRPLNVIVLTPTMGGADGISEMTRQWVRVLESQAGREVGTLDVWSLDDPARPGGAQGLVIEHEQEVLIAVVVR